MSYIKKNLMENEKILYSAQVNPAIFTPAVISFIGVILFSTLAIIAKEARIFLILFSGLLLVITIRLAIEAAIIITTTELAVTNRRIIAKTGFIHQNTIEILLSKVESVKIYQNIMGRMMNFGSITITGTGGTKESFRAIIDPTTGRKKINQIIEKYTQVENRAESK